MRADEYVQIAYKDAWYDHVSMDEAKAQHRKNVAACKAAAEWHAKKDRPLSILAVHGSGRSTFMSCARELSNSQMLLQGALEQFYVKPDEYEVTEVPLRAHNIQPCNCCYSTASSLCNWSCSCWPLDSMSTELYPLVLKCDVMLISTGVNQSAMAGRLKLFLDRLVSADGGFYMAELPKKDGKFKDQMIALSTELAAKNEMPYDARMWGRVGAYFITSKDQTNENETAAKPFDSPLNYAEAVAHSLRDGQADYGFFHDPDDWYAAAWTNPNEEMSYDKRYLSQHPEFGERAALVARKAVELAKRLRENPTPFDGGARPPTRT